MILGYVKLGTIPFGPAHARRKRKAPVIGEFIYIRKVGGGNLFTNPWIYVVVKEYRKDDIWFVARI